MIDNTGNKFSVKVKSPNKNLINKLVNLRCVDIKNKKVIISARSACLIVPNYFYDALKFTESKSQSQGKQKLLKDFEWLNSYNLSDATIKNGKSTPNKRKERIVSIVKKCHTDKPVSGKKLQDVFKNSHQHRNEKFLFEGRVVNVHGADDSSVLKTLNRNSRKVSAFNSSHLTKNSRVFYHFVLQIQDDSMKKPLNVYVNSSKGDHHMFETWEVLPPSDLVNRWKQVKTKQVNNFCD